MFFKKSNKEVLAFEEALKKIIDNPTVKKNSELIQVFQSAIEKLIRSNQFNLLLLTYH